MFKTILNWLGFNKTKSQEPELSKEEKMFNSYVEWLYSLDIDTLKVKLEVARHFSGPVNVQFLEKIIAKKKLLKKSPPKSKYNGYEDTVGFTDRTTRMAEYIALMQQRDEVVTKGATSGYEPVEAKGGKFDGGGASGDWESTTPPVRDLINSAPRVYTHGTIDRDRRPPIEQDPLNNSGGLAPLNPVYHAPAPSRSSSARDDDSDSNRASSGSRSSHTLEQYTAYHNPPPTYSPPSYEPPSHSHGCNSDTTPSGSCDGGGGSSPSCD